MSDMDLTHGKCLERMEGEQIDLDKKQVGGKNGCSQEAGQPTMAKGECLISFDCEDGEGLKREKKKRKLNEDFVKRLEFIIEEMEQIVEKECLENAWKMDLASLVMFMF